MTDFHIVDCPISQSLPDCSRGGHACSLSCLTLWIQHLKECTLCEEHISIMANCGNQHCHKIKQIWLFRSMLIEILCVQKLKADGQTFTDIMQLIKQLMAFDWYHISYMPTKTMNPTEEVARFTPDMITMKTTIAFTILKALMTLQDRYLAMDPSMNIKEDGEFLLDYLWTMELIPYFKDM